MSLLALKRLKMRPSSSHGPMGEIESHPLIGQDADGEEKGKEQRGNRRSCSQCAWWADPAFRTIVLVNIASVVERADEALLPAVYREIGNEFHASPSALGAISLARALAQALSFPLAAILVLLMPRVSIVALGALIWGVATAGVGFGASYLQVAIWRGINGLGLALVIPAIQSLVADSASDSARGTAFGWLQFVTNWGNMLGGALGVTLAGVHPMGIPGWRLAFHLVAVISIVLAGIIHLFASDPAPQKDARESRDSESDRLLSSVNSDSGGNTNTTPNSHGDVELSLEPSLRGWADKLSPEKGDQREVGPPLPRSSSSSTGVTPWRELWRQAIGEAVQDTLHVLRVPSFCIIVLQGIVGTFAWAAFAFAIMWLELLGFSNTGAAIVMTGFAISMCLGGLFGGWFGDRMARSLPNSGRIIVAQISSGSAVVACFVVLRLLPADVSWWKEYLVALSVTGFLISWNAAATNNPIFAEIVPERSRTNVYALDRTFEVAFASFAPLTVGYIAENYFGFKNEATGSHTARDPQNAKALAGGLFLGMAIPFGLCCLCYGFLYWTYPKDRDKIRSERGVTELVTGQ